MSSITKICKIEKCNKPVKSTGLCSMHWARLSRHNDVNYQGRIYHGMNRSPEHIAWKAMKQRCYNKNFYQYYDYGGRGIKVCDKWLYNFQAFFNDMGYKPSLKHSLDRIDNNKDYSPDNCKWSTKVEQMNNTRDNIIITYKGKTQSLKMWSEETKINYNTLYTRIKRKWPLEKVFTREVSRWARM